jgi:hypothetical protein
MSNAWSPKKFAGRLLAALALAVIPSLASAEPYARENGTVALGATLGFDTGNSITQIRITGEGQFTITDLAPKLYIELAGHLGVMFGSESVQQGFSSPSAIAFEAVPAARLRFALDDKLSFYGDVGLGIAYFAFGSTSIQTGGGTFTIGGGSQTWGLFRIALGVQYKVTPRIFLFGEPVGLNVYVGTNSGFMYSLAIGALFKL